MYPFGFHRARFHFGRVAADLRQVLVELFPALGARSAVAKLPEHAQKAADRELSRLERLPPAAAEYGVIRTYLEWILELPWQKSTPDTLDLVRAREVLDEDHYDLDDIKERILEHLAVIKLNPKTKAPILCFVGPTGVGQTSLGQITTALAANWPPARGQLATGLRRRRGR